MFIIVGFLVVIISVIGGYFGVYGCLGVFWQFYELVIIGGVVFGVFLVGILVKMVKQILQVMVGVFKGLCYKQQDYIDVFSLFYELFNKVCCEGFMVLEDYVECLVESVLFGNYFKVQVDYYLIDFIIDCLCLMIGSNIELYELELLLELELEKYYVEVMVLLQVLIKVVDGLFGFGIVVVVLGIVIIMGLIGGDIVEVGGYVVGVLVGIFFGILLGYGFVGLMVVVMEVCVEQDSCIYELVKIVLLVCLCGYNLKIVLEFVCKMLLLNVCLVFFDFEQYLKMVK